KTEPELLFEGSGENAPHRMTLPPDGMHNLIDCCTLGSTQHRDHRVLLRWALCVRCWLRLRQRLNCRPQLIDQRPAVADLPPLLDTGKSVPQGQQPLAVERGGMQFLVRSDDNLTLIHCGWRLAAQRNPVIADDIDAHGWGLLIDPGGCRRDPHSRSLRRPKPLDSG